MNLKLDNSILIAVFRFRYNAMAGWQITAATVYCDDISDEVTVVVQRDGAVRCVRYSKPSEPNKRNTQVKCNGPECRLVIDYRDRLFAEEANQAVTDGLSGENGPEKRRK